MLVLDYLIVNEDRHLNNFGLIRNAVTPEWIGAAPLYDNGNLIGAVIGGKMRISKQSLIGHLSSPETVRKVGTEQLRKLLAGYKKAEK